MWARTKWCPHFHIPVSFSEDHWTVFTERVLHNPIEHIGFDNSQYGINLPAQYSEPSVEPFIISLRKLAELCRPGGSMLISFPYGHREVLVHPITEKKSSQVFDFSSIEVGLAELRSKGFHTELKVFAADINGWSIINPRTCDLRYADGCPAASAVAMMFCEKQQ